MVLPGQAAQPLNQQSTALGLAIRKVRVEQVVPERGVAIVVDEMQYMTEIPYRLQQGRGRIPRVGDYWYVDRTMGPWTFAFYIAKDDADITTFDGPLNVTGAVHMEQGLFIVEGLSVGTGLFVGEGAHVVGQIHSVAGVSTVGNFTVSGQQALVDRTWTALTLAAGMSADGGASTPAYVPAYQLRSNNTVRLRGGIAGTISSGETILTLPVSIRPSREIRTAVASSASAAANQTVRLEIFPSGVVAPSFSGGGTANFIYLDGVEYDLV